MGGGLNYNKTTNLKQSSLKQIFLIPGIKLWILRK